jgi:L-fuculose-phosphate aldolase
MAPAQVPFSSQADSERELVRCSQLLHARGWVANHDGNLSARLRGQRLLITPTALSKAAVSQADLLVVDETGKVLSGKRRPFGELDLHQAVYGARPDVGAVIHAHPPFATALGIAGLALPLTMMPEPIVSLGPSVPCLPYAAPKSNELRSAVSAAALTANALLLARNGVLCFGPDPDTAYLRLELVEHQAHIFTIARQLGGPALLTAEQCAPLLDAHRKAGLAAPQAAATAPAAATPRVASSGGSPGEIPHTVTDIAAFIKMMSERIVQACPGYDKGAVEVAVAEEMRKLL